MHVDRTALALIIIIPYLTHDLITGQHELLIMHHIVEQLELLQCELRMNLLAAFLHADPVLRLIESDLVKAERRSYDLLRRLLYATHLRAPEQGLDTAQHLHDAERLRHIIIGTEVEGGDLIRLGRLCGQHHHRNLRELRASPETAQDLDTIDPRHHDIQQHQCRLELLGIIKEGLAITEAARLVAIGGQRIGYQLLNTLIVFYNCNSRHLLSPVLYAP